jgi:CopG family nickel-responsive transcriptional regulator
MRRAPPEGGHHGNVSPSRSTPARFDELIRTKGYRNREAVRDLLRQHCEHQLQRDEAPNCIAALSYIYNHHERELAERLTTLQHRHHDLTLSTMHAHLDHDDCIETVFLRGPTPAVRDFANLLLAERGVRHGMLNLIPADIEHGHHPHSATTGDMRQAHVHSRPKT